MVDVTGERRAAAALAQAELQYRALVESVDAVLWRADPVTLNFRYLSPRAEDLLGFPIERWTEDPAFWATRLHPDDRHEVVQGCTSAIARGEDYSLQYRLIHADGREIWVHHAVHILLDQDGRPEELLGIFFDITERRRLEAQVRQAQKMEAVGRLAGGIAHDFNNLMGVVTGYSELLLSELPPDHAERTALEAIRTAGDRAAALTRQLLAYSRQQRLEPTALDLNQLVRGFDGLLRRVVGAEIDVVVELVPRVWPARADANQLEQVVLNLAVNARDAMPGGGRLVVRTANVTLDDSFIATHPGSRRGDFAVLEVSDSGVGMDRATLARVFEPFFTTKEVGRGSGLGLATVYGIVKQSDGYVEVESEPGRGTRVAVYLPRSAEPAKPAEARLQPAPTPRPAATVLVVEDDPPLRQLVQRVLSRAGYRVVAAPDPNAALALVEAGEPIDLMLSDVVMPGMSGTDLAAAVRLKRPALEVLLMSGYSREMLDDPRAGDLAFLQKPFRVDDLLGAVAKLIEPPPSPGEP